MATRSRLLLIAGLVGVVVAAVLVDGAADRPDPPVPLGAASTPDTPTATPEDSLSSTWYCPGGQAGLDQPADTSVVLANPTGGTVGGRLTVQPVAGDPKEVAVSVAPRGQTVVKLSDAYGEPVVAGATIDLDQGGIVAQQTIRFPEGTVASACASAASPTWYAPAGSTGRDNNTFLSILNPFPDDAIVDLSFASDQGGAAPADLQGVVVPSQEVVVVDVGDKVRRRDFIASQVTSRRGRVVVSKTQRRGSSITASLAAPATSSIWYFPSGAKVDGLSDRLHLFNPGEVDARVTVQLNLEQAAVEPQEVTVPAKDQIEVQVNANPEIPKGAGYGLTVQSSDDFGVVAERTFVATQPVSAGTYADELGLVAGAERWVSATAARAGHSLSVVNLGLEEATVSLTVLDGGGGPVPGLGSVKVPSGGRSGLNLDGKLANTAQAVMISADQPVLVDRGGFDPAGPTSSYTAAVALG